MDRIYQNNNKNKVQNTYYKCMKNYNLEERLNADQQPPTKSLSVVNLVANPFRLSRRIVFVLNLPDHGLKETVNQKALVKANLRIPILPERL